MQGCQQPSLIPTPSVKVILQPDLGLWRSVASFHQQKEKQDQTLRASMKSWVPWKQCHKSPRTFKSQGQTLGSGRDYLPAGLGLQHCVKL